MAKAKEVATAIRKAITAAKLNLISVQRGTVRGNRPRPRQHRPVQGERTSRLHPCHPHARSKGQGLVIGKPERACCNSLASRTCCPDEGPDPHNHQLRRATFNALKNINTTRVTNAQRENLYIHTGRKNA